MTIHDYKLAVDILKDSSNPQSDWFYAIFKAGMTRDDFERIKIEAIPKEKWGKAENVFDDVIKEKHA